MVCIWSISAERNNPLFIGFNISAKFSYPDNNGNIKNDHIPDTNMVADILCVPTKITLNVTHYVMTGSQLKVCQTYVNKRDPACPWQKKKKKTL